MYSDFSSHFRYRNKTTMVYVDVTGPQRLDALGTLEDESESSLGKKWKNRDGGLIGFCGLRGR